MAENTQTPANPVQNWTVNGRTLSIQTGVSKRKDDKGLPVFRFVPSGDPTKQPTLGDVLGVVAALGVDGGVATIIDREILSDLAREISEAIRVKQTGPDGKEVIALNAGLVADTAKKVVAAYLQQKAGKEAIKSKLAELADEQNQIMGRLMLAFNKGENMNSDELKKVGLRGMQLMTEIAELKKKLEPKPKAAAPAAPAK